MACLGVIGIQGIVSSYPKAGTLVTEHKFDRRGAGGMRHHLPLLVIAKHPIALHGTPGDAVVALTDGSNGRA